MTTPGSSGLDPALPASDLLLDSERAGDLLDTAAGTAEVGAVDATYLRWKPGTNLVVRYDLTVDGRPTTASALIRAEASGNLARKAADPDNRRLASVAARHAGVAAPLWHEPWADVLVQWFPLDLRLPALANGATAVAERAGAADRGSDHMTLLAYKPRRRAVQRVGGAVVKVHAAEADATRAALAARMASAALGPHAADLIGANQQDRSTAHAWVNGRSLSDGPPQLVHLREVVERLHAAAPTGLPEGGAAQHLMVAVQTARLVAAAMPGLAATVDHVLRCLGAEVPVAGASVLCHGDLSADQVVDSPGRDLVLLDFDEAVAGPAVLDWASFAAAGVRGVDDLDQARDTLAGLAPTLDPAEMRWWLATSLLRRAATPLRQIQSAWPELVTARVAAAAAALGR